MYTYRIAVTDPDGTVLDVFEVEMDSPPVGSPPQQARAVFADAVTSFRLGVL